MAKQTKVIDWDTGLKARHLFALAAEHYRKCRDYELALIAMLDIDDGGYGGGLSDELYQERPNFDAGLELVGIKIGARPKTKRAHG
jgi:hypothetical protein